MNTEQLNTLPVGAIVFIVLNTGMTGISKYQYIGVVKNNFDDLDYHVFLSEYFLSTVCLVKGKEKRNWNLKNIFILEADAKQRQKEIGEEESKVSDEMV